MATSTLLPSVISEAPTGINAIELYVQKIFPDFRLGSFAGIISSVQVIVYLVAVSKAFLQDFHFSDVIDIPSCTLYSMGSTFGSGLVHDLEIYRLFTPLLLHANIFQLVVNVVSQIQLLLSIESSSYLSGRATQVLYLVSGTQASLASMVFNPYNISVGSAGALFGLLGYRSCELWLLRNLLEQNIRKQMASQLYIVLGLNVLITMGSPVANGSILFFGFLAGVLIAPALLSFSQNSFESISEPTQTKSRLSFCSMPLLFLSLLSLLYLQDVKKLKLNC